MVIPTQGRFSEKRRLPWHRQSSEDVDLYFGQLGRDGLEELQSASRLILGVPLLKEIINAMPLPVAVLNDKAQVVLTNRCWDRLVGKATDCLLGARHGELLGCIRCEDGPEREDQMVTNTPIQVDGRDFSIFVLHDVDPLVAVEHLGI